MADGILAPFVLSTYGFQGVFGMGRETTTGSLTNSFLTQAVIDGKIPSTTWSYQPSGDFSVAGSMVIGGYNVSQIVGEINWVPSPIDQYYWNSTVQSLMYAGVELLNADYNVTFVTGYRYIGLPQSVWD
jgi:hypothetical protein